MYSKLPDDIRQGHPFHMIEEIKAQPEAVSRSLALVESRGAAALRILSRAKRVIFTGCGTSFNAALGGAWMMRELGSLDARAIQAWDLLSYGGLQPGDVVVGVTHSGSTVMTLRALQTADAAGIPTIAVTGFPEAVGVRESCVCPTGYDDERSWAHTASYTAALATLAALANELASSDRRLDLAPLGDVLTESLGIEDMAHRLAASIVTEGAHTGLRVCGRSGWGPEPHYSTGGGAQAAGDECHSRPRVPSRRDSARSPGIHLGGHPNDRHRP